MFQAAVLSLLLCAAGEGRPKLIVLDLAPAGGVAPEVASAMTEAITSELGARGFFDVLASKEVGTLLGQERQKQMLGCSEGTSCMTELAGAMGARFVLSGSLAKLGDAYQLSLQTLDSMKAQPLGRSTRLAKDLGTLSSQLAFSVAEATATPLPPPPSHLFSYSLMGGGGALIVGGGVVGLLALSNQAALNRELANGDRNPASLQDAASYREEAQSIGTFQTASLAALGAGAALLVAGIVLDPSDTPGAAPKLALFSTGSGLAVTGVFP